MSKTRSAVLAILMLAIAGMFVAACGGDDDDTQDPTATSEQSGSTATATAEPGDPTDAPTATGNASDPTDEPDDGATVADACALLTKQEAEAALGATVLDPYVTYTGTANVGLTSAQATVSTCAYTGETSIASVNMNYWSSPGNAAEIRAMVAEGVNGACVNKEMIDGLGDVACWYDSQHVEIQLATGSSFLDIFVTMEGDSTDALLDIAEKAVNRLS